MVDVTLYTRKFCGYCTAAKRLLAAKDVAYNEIDATFSQQSRSEMMERSGRMTFPQVFIADKHVGGYDDLRQLEHRGMLDRMLRPEKT